MLKEPVLHFLVAGALLFAAHRALSDDVVIDNPREIVVSEATLVEFLQRRSVALDMGLARARLRDMTADERRRLIQEHIREEALYREARTLDLDRGDPVVRQRLVQKMKSLSTELAEPIREPRAADLERFYKANQRDFAAPAEVSFVHVFLSHLRPQAKDVAEALLKQLNQARANADSLVKQGDVFPYPEDYTGASRGLIESRFGETMTDQLFSTPPSERWHGPWRSPHGWHLVRVTSRSEARVPPLEAVKREVSLAWHRAEQEQQLTRGVDQLLRSYSVRYDIPWPMDSANGDMP